MDKTKDNDIYRNAAPISAEQLRMTLLKEQMEVLAKEEQLRARKKEELEKFTDSFMKEHVSDEELAMVRRIILDAVKNGKYEAMVYSFPSDLCTDSGRAINSGDPQWTDTLLGKAKELYERYVNLAKPQGYKLKAMIVTFPDGIPGDVGFFLNWAPETK